MVHKRVKTSKGRSTRNTRLPKRAKTSGNHHDDVATLVAVGNQLLDLRQSELRRLFELEAFAGRHRRIALEVLAGNVEQRELELVTKGGIKLLDAPKQPASAKHSAKSVGARFGIDQRSVGYLATTRGLKTDPYFFEPRARRYTTLASSILGILNENRQRVSERDEFKGADTRGDRAQLRNRVLEILTAYAALRARASRAAEELQRQMQLPKKSRKSRRRR